MVAEAVMPVMLVGKGALALSLPAAEDPLPRMPFDAKALPLVPLIAKNALPGMLLIRGLLEVVVLLNRLVLPGMSGFLIKTVSGSVIIFLRKLLTDDLLKLADSDIAGQCCQIPKLAASRRLVTAGISGHPSQGARHVAQEMLIRIAACCGVSIRQSFTMQKAHCGALGCMKRLKDVYLAAKEQA